MHRTRKESEEARAVSSQIRPPGSNFNYTAAKHCDDIRVVRV